MNIKCIITDVDLTLTNCDMQLTSRTINAVKKVMEHGVQVVLCSGRPFQGMKKYIKELELDKPGCYSAGFNGGVIYEHTLGQVIHVEAFTADGVSELVDMLQKAEVNFHLESPQKIFTIFKSVGRFTVRDCFVTEMPLEVLEKDAIIKRTDICKVMIADEPEKLDRFIVPKKFENKYKFVRSRPYYLEVVPRNVNKGVAVKRIAEILSLKKDEILGIGDGLNDLELLQESGYAVAVDNADEELKKVADLIVPHHNEDGFAQMLEKLLKEIPPS